MNTKLKCLLLDDELPSLTYLKLLGQQIPELEIVKIYNCPTRFMEDLPTLEFDLAILDIEMPGISGLEIAKTLSDKAIIFTTAYSEYAADAFDLNAIDYIRKPLQLDRLRIAVEKAILFYQRSRSSTADFITLNTNIGKYILYFHQILYIRTSSQDSRDKTISLNSGKDILAKNISLQALMEQLPAAKFCQINKKEIIAMNIVRSFSHDLISSTLVVDQKFIDFTLGEKYRTDFIQKLAL
ncbi:LytR/AlgR family response regulator transcription factor [Sphingobacterium sp. Mn56C]|uniref:LytR/AlgR family response regulator transcription factor n=1 Tax=Sphingobacterium sp. Mn56C TaxID=3395261 RepID=UPI003BD14913